MGILTRDDWSLDRRGHIAQARHRAKVKAAILSNLPDLVSEESIILGGGTRNIRIPVKSLDEPHFYYEHQKRKHVGQGTGEAGTTIGKAGGTDDSRDSGAGEAGDKPGTLQFDAFVELEDIETALFAQLTLPNLRKTDSAALTAMDSEWSDIRRHGVHANIDRKRTLLEAIRRNRREDRALVIAKDDLRFRTWDEESRPQAQAVVIAMMDVSGSMGMNEKFISRTFFFWMERFLRRMYQDVQIRYLVHHTVAYETTREQFFSVRENGGTVCSSVFEAAIGIVQRDYREDEWNVYPVYVGDGENLFADNERTSELVQRLCSLSRLVGYLEINRFARQLSLKQVLQKQASETFRIATIADRRQVFQALKTVFSEAPESTKAR